MTPPRLRDGDHEVLAIVLEAGTHGMSRAAIAGRADRTEGAVSLVLRRLRRRELIEPSHEYGGQALRWGAPGTTAAYAATTTAASLAREARHAQRKAARESARGSTWSKPVRHASVWEYARQQQEVES